MNKTITRYCLYYPAVFLRGERVSHYLTLYNQMQRWSKEAICEHQRKQLIGIIHQAMQNVPFYKEHYKNVDLSKINTLEDMSRLPTTDKSNLRSDWEMMQSKTMPFFASLKTTGGSTGQAVTVVKTRDSLARERAATWRAYAWAGIEIGDPQGRFWGTPFTLKARIQARLIDLVSNRVRLSAFDFNDQGLQDYYLRLLRFKPRYLYGYVSMIERFARFVEANKYDGLSNLHCVITTSEVLTDVTKKYIERIFRCKVFNEYGCGEVGSIAHECEMGSMHLMAENLIVEILNGDKASNEGEVGEIVVTELNNYAMPLIRYRLGDYAEVAPQNGCSCGRPLPIIKNVVGRAYDMIELENGQLFHGEFFMYIMEEVQNQFGPAVNQFQIVQLDKRNICVRIVPGREYSEVVEEAIRRRIRLGMGGSIDIACERVNIINRERSGKMRLIKACRVDAIAHHR
jgi:phenylacetate-CoA ligase